MIHPATEVTTEIKIRMNKSILLSLKEKKEDFVTELLFNNAVALYKKNKLSLGKAAELAGYSRTDFIWKLKDAGEPIFDYDDDFVSDMVYNATKASEIIKKL